jgi:hypothetical protein
VIGTICFLVVFYRGGMKGLRLFRTAKDPFLRGLGIGLVGMIVASLATNVTSETWHYLAVTGYFWVLLAMVVIAQDLAATEQKAEAESSPEQKPAEQAAG